MTEEEHSSRLINWHESVQNWCKVEDLGVQSYKVKMEIPPLYHTTGCDKFPLWVCYLFKPILNIIFIEKTFYKYLRINKNYKGIIAGFFLMFAASILFLYYDRIHMMHLCPEWLKKNTHYAHGNASHSLVNNER